jgi:hypothetical protein
LRVTVCQLDNRPGALEPAFDALAAHIHRENSDFLLLPEMWFFEWRGVSPDTGAICFFLPAGDAACIGGKMARRRSGRRGLRGGLLPVIEPVEPARQPRRLWRALMDYFA